MANSTAIAPVVALCGLPADAGLLRLDGQEPLMADMEEYTTGTGQHLLVHSAQQCTGTACVIHNPSAHHMRDWPTNWRADRYLMERMCPHGVGHPDPDDLAFKRAHPRFATTRRADTDSVHGCDGCCAGPKCPE